jgi:hypothetical protein
MEGPMEPTDAELYAALLEQLTEAGRVIEDPGTGVLILSGFPSQRSPALRLHLTPELLGRALRDLTPTFAEQFPLLAPLEAALVAFFLHVLGAIEEAGPYASDIELSPPGAEAWRSVEDR